MDIRKLTLLVLVLLQFHMVKAQTINPIKIPLGSAITLSATSSDGFTYQWYRDGNALPQETRSTLTTKIAGSYQVSAINTGNCTSDLSDPFLVLTVYSDLSVIKKSETRLIGPNETFDYVIKATNNGNTDNTNVVVTDILPPVLIFESADNEDAEFRGGAIIWNIPSLMVGVPQQLVVKVRGKREGLVINTATISSSNNVELPDPDLSNNTSTDTKKIIGNIRVPNVITPNGDGKNDVLKIDGIELYKENSLSIFNRWGNEVYRSNGAYKNNWSGEGLSEGTYYFVLKLVSREGNAENATGWITLLRDK